MLSPPRGQEGTFLVSGDITEILNALFTYHQYEKRPKSKTLEM